MSRQGRGPETQEPITSGARSKMVDIVKGIAIILVVYGHTAQGMTHRGWWVSPGAFFSRTFIYSFHMPAFFFVAGLFVLGSAIGYREKPEEPYEEVTAAVVPNTAKTKVFVRCLDGLPGALADTGWDFLVGNAPHAIEDKQDNFANGWHSFTFTLDGVSGTQQLLLPVGK